MQTLDGAVFFFLHCPLEAWHKGGKNGMNLFHILLTMAVILIYLFVLVLDQNSWFAYFSILFISYGHSKVALKKMLVDRLTGLFCCSHFFNACQYCGLPDFSSNIVHVLVLKNGLYLANNESLSYKLTLVASGWASIVLCLEHSW